RLALPAAAATGLKNSRGIDSLRAFKSAEVPQSLSAAAESGLAQDGITSARLSPRKFLFHLTPPYATFALFTLVGALLFAVSPPSVSFTDITAKAGIHFTHNSGRAGKKYLPETMGAGCAFLDADGDGWPDILLINSRDF